MSVSNAHALIHINLIVLHRISPGKKEFTECLKEGMFAQPNRKGFEQVMYYLLYTYDSKRCLAQVTWPLIERSRDRLFRRDVVAFVKEIAKERPEANLPAFSPSFLTNPGGDRFAKFMWKLSEIVMKVAVEGLGGGELLLDFPSRGIRLFQNLATSSIDELKKEILEFSTLLSDSFTTAKKISSQIMQQAKHLKEAQAELAQMLPLLENAPLNKFEKQSLLSNSQEVYLQVINKWQSELEKQMQEVKDVLTKLAEDCRVVKCCSDSVKGLVKSQTTPLFLDATQLPLKARNHVGPLNLAELFSDTAEMISQLLHTLSECGGLQPLDPVLPYIEDTSSRLRIVESALGKTNSGYIELVADIGSGLGNLNLNSVKESQETPQHKLRLQSGRDLLMEAKNATPPLVFQVDHNASLEDPFNTDSPPVGGVVDKMRELKKIAAAEGATTPFGTRQPLRSHPKGVKAMRSSSKSKIPVTPAVNGKFSQTARNNKSRLSPSSQFPVPPTASSTVCKTSQSSSCPKPYLKNSSAKVNTLKPRNSKVPQSVKKAEVQNDVPASVRTTLFTEEFEEGFQNQIESNEATEETKSRRLSIRPVISETEEAIRSQKFLDLAADTFAPSENFAKDANWLQSLSSLPTPKPVKLERSFEASPLSPLNTILKSTVKTKVTPKRQNMGLVAKSLPSPTLSKEKVQVKVTPKRQIHPEAASPLSPALPKGTIKLKVTPKRLTNLEVASSPSNVVVAKVTPKHLVPKIQITNTERFEVNQESAPSEFDSPGGLSGVFSPSMSFDNSFAEFEGEPSFMNDRFLVEENEVKSPALQTSNSKKVTGDNISQNLEEKKPHNTVPTEGNCNTAPENAPKDVERRKSLLAVISRFHNLVGSKEERDMKTFIKEPSPDPEFEDICEGDISIGLVDLDFSLEDTALTG